MIQYRRITEADVDGVAALEKRCFSMPWPRSAFAEMVTKENADYFCAIDDQDGQIIGGCALFDIAGEGNITNVAVDEAYRGRGIATELMRFLLEQGDRRGIEEYTLEVRVSNTPAITVYEKVGFHSEGIRPGFYDEPKEDGMIMWKRKC